VFSAFTRLFKEIIAMKNTEIDAENSDIPSNSCNSVRNEEIGIAINSNCATKLILADIDVPVYTVLFRTNMGDDLEISGVDSFEAAERMAKDLRRTTNHMVCIDSANGERLKRWDRQRVVGENHWRKVDTYEMEILGPIRELRSN
jgi:hypothetical protein